MIYDDTICELGEGPLWHPERGEFFWFDILGKRLHRKGAAWNFDTYVSAAGWIDESRMLVASARDLRVFDLTTGKGETVVEMEADNPATRSNDGRADPFGGFWIGTMGLGAEPGAGAIYRYYRGELRMLYPNITIPNAICFDPDGTTAYFCDTADGRVLRQRLSDKDGRPVGEPEVFLDVRGEEFGSDGAVVDAEGNFWNAQWGARRVAGYRRDGTIFETFAFPALQTSCPAFGGDDLKTLFCTSAATNLTEAEIAAYPANGCTFAVDTPFTGQREHKVIL